MNTLKLTNSPADLAQAAHIIKKGGLVAIPTETVYGLAANALDECAVAGIFAAKGRPPDNPLIVHIAKREDMFRLARTVPQEALLLSRAFWPGPLTVILKKRAVVPDIVTAGLDTVAIRMPKHPDARKIIELCDLPLAAPSANISGKPSPTSAAHCTHDLDGRISAVVDGGSCAVGIESTVVSLAGNEPVVLRPGKITVEQLETVLGRKVAVHSAVGGGMDEDEVSPSPGMKHRHYSPKGKLVLIRSGLEAFAKYIYEDDPSDSACALCFDGEEGFLPVPAVSYGRRGDFAAQGERLYDCLRALDDEEADVIYTRAPVNFGLGAAVYNRLFHAAGREVVSLVGGTAVIGITGSSGAGKSTAGKIFTGLGVPSVDADRITRRILFRDSLVYRRLVTEFGKGILDGKKNINRRLLAAKAFATPEDTEFLNRVTHPEIIKRIRSRIRNKKKRGCEMLLLDAPLLLESHADFLCDYVIAVTAEEDSRMKRVCSRDCQTAEEIQLRFSAQRPDDFYRAGSDFHVINDGTEQDLEIQIKKIFTEIKGDIHEIFSQN